MTTLTLIAVRLAEGVLASSARERWHGVSNPSSGNSDFMYSIWFKIAAIVLFASTVIAFVVISLYNRFSQRKIAERTFAEGMSRKQLTEQETSILIAITNRVGLERKTDIFMASDAFDKGADMLVKETLVAGNPTNETSNMEKHLAALREKMNYRKAAVSVEYSKDSGKKTAESTSTGATSGKWVFVALFPFSKKMDLINRDSRDYADQVHPPPQWREQLPKFVPAAITGLLGRVLFIETWLPANVGDRLLITVGSYSVKGDCCTLELIEDIGTVDRSICLSESTKGGGLRRLGINLAGLSESQVAQLPVVIKLTKKPQIEKRNAENSKETAGASVPVSNSSESEGMK
jgi:hypothetical protein